MFQSAICNIENTVGIALYYQVKQNHDALYSRKYYHYRKTAPDGISPATTVCLHTATAITQHNVHAKHQMKASFYELSKETIYHGTGVRQTSRLSLHPIV